MSCRPALAAPQARRPDRGHPPAAQRRPCRWWSPRTWPGGRGLARPFARRWPGRARTGGGPMRARVMSRGAAQRLLAFLPPRRALLEGGGQASLGAGTVVGYGGIDASQHPCSAGDAPLSLLPKAASVDLLFDASDVFTALLDAPRMSEARLRQALPSLVEERLLSDAAHRPLAYAIRVTAGTSLPA